MWIGPGLLVLAGVILVAVLGSAVSATPMKLGGGQVFGCFFAVALGLFGLVFLLPWFFNTANACRGCYVVTNRRALLVEMSMWQRGAAAHSYLPQQLLGLDRRDHPTVAGAGDLVFEYIFALSGSSFNLKTGSLFQQGVDAGPSSDPQRVARGFMGIDQVREVEDLIRTALLSPLEQELDAQASVTANRGALPRPAPAIAVPCPCGVTLAAPPALAGKSVKCPSCKAAVALPAPAADAEAAADPVSCWEDAAVPADVKDKLLKGLDAREKPVWIGQPIPNLILLRNSGYLAVGGFGILAALVWFVILLTPAQAPVPPLKSGKQAAPAPVGESAGNLWMLPAALFVVSALLLRADQPTRAGLQGKPVRCDPRMLLTARSLQHAPQRFLAGRG